MVLGPGVVDQHLERRVEEFGRDHDRKAQDQSDEFDGGEAKEQRRDQDDEGDQQVHSQVRLRRQRPGKPAPRMAETVDRAAQVDAARSAGATNPFSLELGVGVRRHGASDRIRLVSAVMATSSAGSAWS